MMFPKKIPGLRVVTVLTAIYGIAWMSLEGNLTRVTIMGSAVSLLLVGSLMQRYVGGKKFQLGVWLLVIGFGGLLAGIGIGVLTFFLMALKTGIHGHGPEFQPAEIEGVLSMIPLWGLAGLAAGSGLAAVIWGLRREKIEQ
jgi:hypothetical protein